ncbi:MAG: hexokinase [Lentimicrobium sp.]
MNNAKRFLIKHKLFAADINFHKIVNLFLTEMQKGLEKKESSLRMLPSYLGLSYKLVSNQPVIAIDAGGTNFRVATIFFDNYFNLVIENIQYNKMPGADEILTKKEFFDTLAYYLNDYKNVSNKIGFCFSYPVEMYPNKDGKLLEWTKEIKAPGVIGFNINKNLLAALGTPKKQLFLINDAVSALLAGHFFASGMEYETYVGFILGTGTNSSYIEQNINNNSIPNLDFPSSQIINIESGNFGKAPRTDIDFAFDNTTKNPGRYTFEKMISGRYIGGLITTALKIAASEGLFFDAARYDLESLPEFTMEEINELVLGVNSKYNKLINIFRTKEDIATAMTIIEEVIERASKLAAINVAAVVLKSCKATTIEKPVLVSIEGNTVYNLKTFQITFEKYLKEFLVGENQRHFEIIRVENSCLVGAAIATVAN